MKAIYTSLLVLMTCVVLSAQGRFQHSIGITYLNTHTQQQRFIYEPEQRPAYEVLTPKYYKQFMTLLYHVRVNVQQRDASGISVALPIGISAFAEVSNTPAFLREKKNYLLLNLPILGEWAWGYRAHRQLTDRSFGVFAQAGGAMLLGRGTVGDFFTISPYAGAGIRLRVSDRVGLELSYGQNFVPILDLPPYNGFADLQPPSYDDVGVRYATEKDRRQSYIFQFGLSFR